MIYTLLITDTASLFTFNGTNVPFVRIQSNVLFTMERIREKNLRKWEKPLTKQKNNVDDCL